MKSIAFFTPLTLALCFTVSSAILAADKNEKPLSVTFLNGYNGSPRTAIYVSGEPIHMKVVAKNFTVPKTGKCTLSMRYYIVDKEDKIVYSHQEDDVSTRIPLGYSDAKLPLKCPINAMIDPGEYQLVTEMRDKESREIYRNRQPIHFLPWDEFVLAQICFCSAADKTVALGPNFEVGQPVLLQWMLQSPQADEEGYWRLETTLRIFNKAGQNIRRDREPTILEATATSRGILPATAEIQITNAGEYFAEIEVKDLVSGKVQKKSIPFRVFDSLAGVPRAPHADDPFE